MKPTIHFILLLLLIPTFVFAQEKITYKNRAYKNQYKAGIIKIVPVVVGYCFFNKKNSPFDVKSKIGYGFEASLGKKITKNFAITSGFNILGYELDAARLDRSVNRFLADSNYNVMMTNKPITYLNKMALFATASYWEYHPKYVFEAYGKLSLNYVNYKMDVLAYRKQNNSQYSEFQSINVNNQFYGLMPSIGANFNPKITNILYASLGGEYGYFITSSKTVYKTTYNSLGNIQQMNFQLPVPTHFLQAHIGLIIRPKNRIFSTEKKYQLIDFETNANNNR